MSATCKPAHARPLTRYAGRMKHHIAPRSSLARHVSALPLHSLRIGAPMFMDPSPHGWLPLNRLGQPLGRGRIVPFVYADHAPDCIGWCPHDARRVWLYRPGFKPWTDWGRHRAYLLRIKAFEARHIDDPASIWRYDGSDDQAVTV